MALYYTERILGPRNMFSKKGARWDLKALTVLGTSDLNPKRET
jgi:hypothetical protein